MSVTPTVGGPPRGKDTVANLLVRYLHERGVEYVFGLCGHTNIAVLWRWQTTRSASSPCATSRLPLMPPTATQGEG